MRWSNPWAFLLFLPLLLLLFWIWWRKQRSPGRSSSQPALTFSSIRKVKHISPSFKTQLLFLPPSLRYLALILMVFALARPQEAGVQLRRHVDGVDILFVLDISESMLIEDMLPLNRLQAAKKTLKEFIDSRVSDRMGLVVFSGEAYTRIPLTLDYGLLLKTVATQQTSRNIRMGTALGVALGSAVTRLRESKAKSRVVILLTDGENNSGTIDPETAVEIAKGYGLRVYTIGIGKDGPTRLPIFRHRAGGKRIKSYIPFYSKVNEELLKFISKQTGGRYYRAEKTKNLQEVFREINSLEKSRFETHSLISYKELFPPYVLTALILCLLSWLMEKLFLRKGP